MSTLVNLELQVAGGADGLPDEGEIRGWLEDTLCAIPTEDRRPREVVVRIVDEAESRALNHRYRGRDRATNVLAFPAAGSDDFPDGWPGQADGSTLGDLVLCGPVIAREAAEQRKEITAHWGHMFVHGMLHLLGYDHATEEEAAQMEGLETRILADRGVGDPYAPR